MLFLGRAFAQREAVLYSFTGGSDGGLPRSTLVADRSGNLYGTASAYGENYCGFSFDGCGTAFELVREAGGKWDFNVLYNFQGGDDGAFPASPLAFDSQGNLYGTTSYGGNGQTAGNGTVFALTHTSAGWSESILYAFTGGADGGVPTAGLAVDSAGNLYGATLGGGDLTCASGSGCGVVFELAHTPTGWSEKVLHDFEGTDGSGAYTGVTLVPARRGAGIRAIFGTTLYGGNGYYGPLTGGGVVFEMDSEGGTWSYRTIYEFPENAGRPGGPLIFDRSGLYGMAGLAGSCGVGAVFELTPPTLGQTTWQETNIYNFTGPPNGWVSLYQGVAMDGDQTIYGTTSSGGTSYNCQAGCGTVFRLTRASDGWYESAVYSLTGGTQGWGPFAGVTLDGKGGVYGMSPNGGGPTCEGYGTPGCGVIYEISK